MSIINWSIDPMHSEVEFKIKHLVISTITGSFKKFSGEVKTENEGFDNAVINFTIDVASIDTNQEMRDGHLKNSDFFDVEKYPTITFESTSFKRTDIDNKFKLVGNLTMKDVTKTVDLDVEYGGTEKDNYGNQKYGFEVTGKINRKEFGLTYNSITETGGLAIGEDVKLIANIQVAKKA